jgi:carboxyl-terminal processing protease
MNLCGRFVRPLLVGSVVVGVACSSHMAHGTGYDSALGLQTFDAAWSIVHESHFDTTFNGVDWIGVREELRPQAAAAAAVDDLRGVIRGMLARLGQSHFSLIPREYAEGLDSTEDVDAESIGGDAGLDVRVLDESVVVFRVDSGGPAFSEGIEPGWILLEIDGQSVGDQVKLALRSPAARPPVSVKVWERVMRNFAGPPGAVHRLELLDGHGTRRRVNVTLEPNPGEPVKFGNLPAIYARFAAHRVDDSELGIEVGVIWFNTWMATLVHEVDQAVSDYRSLDGIVIDLRGNTGGLVAMVMGVAGHFYGERTTLGFMKTRHNELRFFANPRRTDPSGNRVDPYSGPVAILIDEMTASASEVLAGGMQATGRARIFGTTSMGAVLPAVTDRLPNGDVLYHAFGDFTTASDVRLEGRGVIPDEVVPLTREELLAGRDAALAAALRWIAGQQRNVGRNGRR